MRYLLLSDIHGNAVALEAVLHSAKKRRWERVLFLGDLVGYYPEAEKVASLLEQLDPAVALLGNHDQLLLDLAAGRRTQAGTDDLVIEGVQRHLQELSSNSLSFIGSFTESALEDNWQAVHGGLRHRWEYIDCLQVARANLDLLERPLCFVGHTHVPVLYASVSTGNSSLWRTVTFPRNQFVYRIPPNARLIFNPGSVGQPRDGLPLASYAIFDDELRQLEHFRVEFDVRAMQRLVRDRGYHATLGTRLAEGR